MARFLEATHMTRVMYVFHWPITSVHWGIMGYNDVIVCVTMTMINVFFFIGLDRSRLTNLDWSDFDYECNHCSKYSRVFISQPRLHTKHYFLLHIKFAIFECRLQCSCIFTSHFDGQTDFFRVYNFMIFSCSRKFDACEKYVLYSKNCNQ